jgi:adenine-specific DNA-methyltransferase
MPTLNWIGKEKVINHHQDVPYKILEPQYTFSIDSENNTTSENKIIHGDNLEALKSLLPEYEGKIKCVYIDPPYNTGNQEWIYNDNVNHPKIKKWLGEIVGKEGEDLSRHDKWLCMMYPRLKLLHKLLADNGVIFISIDDNEYHNLIQITNEIFGKRNKISTAIWDLGTGTQAGHFVRAHEYLLVYAKNKELIPNFSGGEGIIKHSALKKISTKNPKSEFTFPKGTRFDADDNFELLNSWGGSERTTLVKGKMKAMDNKTTEEVTLSAGWAMKSQMESWFYVNSNGTYDTKGQKVSEFYFNKSGVLTYIKEKSVTNPPTVIRNIANTKTGSIELESIFKEKVFDFPKSSELISFLLNLVTKENEIILDSFAGSGTTAHAVFNLNKEDNGNRKFILIEMEDYANTITAERVKRVINGYGSGSKSVEGTGGDFTYYELGKPLFLDNGFLNEEVNLPKILEYVWYSEAKETYVAQKENYLLGTKNSSAYYFYYDKDSMTTLDESFLRQVKTKASQYIIYADNCLLDQSIMDKYNIVFKKIPRDITRF